MRPGESSALRASSPDQPIPLAELGADIARRRAALGDVDMPRNAGNRRTESKKALLKAIEAAGGKW